MTSSPDNPMVERDFVGREINRAQEAGVFGCHPPQELIERLRRVETGDLAMMQAVGSSSYLCNPDGPEAADLLLAYSIEIEGKDAALRSICRETGIAAGGYIDWQRCVDRIQRTAHDALQKDVHDGGNDGV